MPTTDNRSKSTGRDNATSDDSKQDLATQWDKNVTEKVGLSSAGTSLEDPRYTAAKLKVRVADTNPFAAAQIGNVSGPQQSDLRSYQVNLMNQLAQRAQGQGPSIADMQMQRAQEAAMAQQRATLASQRGPANPLAARAALEQQAQTNQAIANQAAVNRIQEQQQAGQQLGSLAESARGQDQQMALAQYQGQLQTALAQGQIDQRTAEAMYQQKAAQNNQQASLDQQYAQMQYNAVNQNNANQEQKAEDQRNARKDRSSALSSVIGAMSDRNAKEDIKPGDKKLEDFLGAIRAYSYNYKNPEHGEGEHVSAMAQDLEKSDIGKRLIVPTAEGKMVDYGKALPSMLAAMGHLNAKIKKLEDK